MTRNNNTTDEKDTSLKDTEKALLNILDDYSEEKYHAQNSQKALLNILDDFSVEKVNMENTQRAVLNILEDYSEEKYHSENTQKALLNILDDYGDEKKKVEVINNDLISANKELEQFAYVASHDLQEPLRTISNFVNLLGEKNEASEDEEIKSYFEFISNATSRMQQLIRDLLEFSRVGRNISFTSIDCNDILKNVLADIEISIKESNAKITYPTLPVLQGNEIELKRLFQNLISNAIKFRQQNIPTEIIISFEEKNYEYLFSIKDNGIGIEENYFHKLFIIFQRLHPVSEYPGTGIGLATCKKIVSLHNGKIWVESKIGVGSTFYFTISKNISDKETENIKSEITRTTNN